jgi:hypothetical protein
MALHTIGTKGANQLSCLQGWPAADPDLGSISAAVVSDFEIGAVNGWPSGVRAVLATATTAGSTSLTVVTARVGSPPITQIHVGDIVLGSNADIVPGTFVTAISGTTVTLSQAASSTGASKAIAFVRLGYDYSGAAGISANGQLFVPNRGFLKVLPGDVVAVDSAGFPYLISGVSIAYAGSDWTFT